jgi:uncharacterized protein (TIGR02996 family)
MKPATHLYALKAAFREIEKKGAVALMNRGATPSAGWEWLAEACAKRGMAKPIGIFWHNQSNGAFERKTGILLRELDLQWAGDAALYCDALRAQALDVVEPSSDAETIRIRPTPLPGGKTRPGLPPLEEVAGEALQAVFDRPDDDAPRIAFAAALEEAGDPRAAFLRLQQKYWSRGTLSKADFKELEQLHYKFGAELSRPLGLLYGDEDAEIQGFLKGSTNYCSFRSPLEDYVAPDFSIKFRYGFVFSAFTLGEEGDWSEKENRWIVTSPAPDVPFESPWWSTVRHVSIENEQSLRKLQATGASERIEALLVSKHIASVIDARAFPRLERIRLRTHDAEVEKWLRSVFPRVQIIERRRLTTGSVKAAAPKKAAALKKAAAPKKARKATKPASKPRPAARSKSAKSPGKR